jgi:hypothetical protein
MASKREWPLWHATSDMTEEEKNEAIDRFLEWRFPNRKEAPRSQDQSDTDVATGQSHFKRAPAGLQGSHRPSRLA